MATSSLDPTSSPSDSTGLTVGTRRGAPLVSRLGFPDTSGSRLPGVDGLRAVAALWVVLFHIQAFSHAHFPFRPLDLFLRSGSTGVSLFLVLSGFCLYVPFAAGRQHRFRTGDFLLRRCRRLLPAYYTSLAFVLVLNLGTFTWLGFHALSTTDAVWQAVTHITLIHPLFTNTFYELNGAYWSLGLEWQLYLSMPFLIWGIRRFGLAPIVATAVICNVVYGVIVGLCTQHGLIAGNSLLATIVLPNQLFGRWAEFAFGMVAAELYVSGRIKHWMSRTRLIVPLLVPALVVVNLWPGFHGLVSGAGHHIMYGMVFFCLLSLVLASDNVVQRMASWRPLVLLGTMSYSLYLVHQPIVQGLTYVMETHISLTPLVTFCAAFGCIPLIVFVAWVLFYTVERKTLTSKKRVQTERAPATTEHQPQPQTAVVG